MADAIRRGNWTSKVTTAALALSIGGVVAALIAAVGSGAGTWALGTGFGILRYALYAAVAGGVLALVGAFMARRRGMRAVGLNVLAFAVALLFAAYLGNQVSTARSVPAIHDVATDLDDMPQFRVLSVRADNLEKVPDMDRPELAAMAPLERWKAIHREAYGDLRSVRVPGEVATTTRRAGALAKERGWAVAAVDPRAGVMEATATTLFFRFKDDVVVRVRPAPGGGSIVDMRSISRVGGSDVGVNAERVRSFLKDLAAA